MKLLPNTFYKRPCLDVARSLLGAHIHCGKIILRITEVEAYLPDDSACHAYKGKTKRNEVMWGEPGHVYVYLCYGIHWMLNFVTNKKNEAAAVLIRSCEPVKGMETILERRNKKFPPPSWGRVRERGQFNPELLTGPGKVGQALGLNKTFLGLPLFKKGKIFVTEGRPATKILSGPRVGINYALAHHRDAPWRLADGNSEWVSERKSLREDGKGPSIRK